jgi:hypothetical protein
MEQTIDSCTVSNLTVSLGLFDDAKFEDSSTWKKRTIVVTNRIPDSATLQSTQWIINAAYNRRIIQSTPLYTA